jgi:hypothetical protein
VREKFRQHNIEQTMIYSVAIVGRLLALITVLDNLTVLGLSSKCIPLLSGPFDGTFMSKFESERSELTNPESTREEAKTDRGERRRLVSCNILFFLFISDSFQATHYKASSSSMQISQFLSRD